MADTATPSVSETVAKIRQLIEAHEADSDANRVLLAAELDTIADELADQEEVFDDDEDDDSELDEDDDEDD